MWTYALLTFYRSLTRHPLYAGLNVLGLTLGIAVFLVLSLYVAFESSFERWIPDAPSIYVIRTSWFDPGHAMGAPASQAMGGLIDELKADYPQVVGTRIWGYGGTVRQGRQTTSEQVDIVDPNLFAVFDLPLIAGDRGTALGAPDSVLLSEARARTYFPGANPIGQVLTISMDGKERRYRVTGILKDLPKNSDLTLDIAIPFAPWAIDDQSHWKKWGSVQLPTYLRFDRAADAAALNQDLDRFIDRHAVGDLGPTPHALMKIRAVPILSLHLIDPKDAIVVKTLEAVGLLTLVLAGVNYINLATARASLRAREVALRKVLGATRGGLIAQFMIEAVLTAGVASLLSLAICELALPSINAASGLSLHIAYFGENSVLPFVIGVVLALGIGAGLYPALALSGFSPSLVFASAGTPGGGRSASRVREILVIGQFAIAIAFTIATVIIVSQGRFLRQADLGFQRSGLIVISSFNDDDVTAAQRSSLLTDLRTIPGVMNVTYASKAPGYGGNTSAQNFKRPGDKTDGPAVNYVVVGPAFVSTYGARLLAGRILDRSHGLDGPAPSPPGANQDARDTLARQTARNILLNVNALKTLGFSSPKAALGQQVLFELSSGGFQTLNVVGVIDNIRFDSPRLPIPPTAFFFNGADFEGQIATVRYASSDPQAIMAHVQADWRQVAPTVPFRGRRIEDYLTRYYKADDQRGRLFTIGAALAVFIGCVGLYGLAAFNTTRRVREIGIRKTLGASTQDILRLLIGQFLRPVLLANLIAWPLAYVTMSRWLSGFDQRIGLDPGYFILATILTLAIAVLTVASQAYAVARSEPAKALRHD